MRIGFRQRLVDERYGFRLSGRTVFAVPRLQ
jgi:hypothetical protein